jgi:hypothetical protein
MRRERDQLLLIARMRLDAVIHQTLRELRFEHSTETAVELDEAWREFKVLLDLEAEDA